MGDNRESRAKKNIVFSLSMQLITLVCGFVVPKMMLGQYGSDVYGATTSIAQFLSYIALLEGGIGGVARAALYKPLAENDQETISAIMAEIKKFFRIVAYVFIAYVLGLACMYQSIAHVESLDWITTFLLVCVISISTLGQYFIGISNATLLQAAQKTYITHLVNIVGTVTNTIAVAALILLDSHIIVVKLVSSTVFLFKPIFLWWYVSKHYKIEKTPKTSKRYLTQKWSGLGQHIAYFLHSNTDVVVLTCLVNLKAVAVYSVYNMVISNINNISISFVSGMEALFGDMLARGEREQLQKTFGRYETMISTVACILFSITAVMIVPFVRIYTSGITDANYEEPLFALFLILSALLYCLRLPYHAVVIAAGHFRQTSKAAYGEAIINIVLSVVLVLRYGLAGIAFATLLATAFRLVYYVIYLSRNILFRKGAQFVKRMVVNAASFGLSVLIGSTVTSILPADNFLQWLQCAIVSGIIAGVVVLGANWLCYRDDCKRMLKRKLA